MRRGYLHHRVEAAGPLLVGGWDTGFVACLAVIHLRAHHLHLLWPLDAGRGRGVVEARRAHVEHQLVAHTGHIVARVVVWGAVVILQGVAVGAVHREHRRGVLNHHQIVIHGVVFLIKIQVVARLFGARHRGIAGHSERARYACAELLAGRHKRAYGDAARSVVVEVYDLFAAAEGHQGHNCQHGR